MMYTTGKLARAIATELEIQTTKVWDVLEELGYEPQELDKKQINQWSLRVSKKLFNN